MKIRTRSNIILTAIAAALQCTLAIAAQADTHSNTSDSRKTSGRQEPTGTPQYQIFDIGVVEVGDEASQGFGVSPAGIAVGRSLSNDGSQAFTWTLNGGLVGLPNLAGRSYCVSNSANDSGIVVGTGATTAFGIRPVTGNLAKWRGFAASPSSWPNTGRRELGKRFKCCGGLSQRRE